MNDKMQQEFISTLSHEIRTPLTSIKGFSKTMLDNWEKLDDIQKKSFLNIICSQSERLINLVENVLNVSKIDSGTDSLVMKRVDLKKLLNSAINICKMAHRDFEFKLTIKSDEPVMADADKLEQVLINILDNALKYSRNSKIIEIETCSSGNFALLSVKNFGVIIDEKYKDKIFEKFFRIDSYLTNSQQGSGLGLYITKTLIKQMGGQIEVISNQNPESVEFIISLPLYEAENAVKNALKSKSERR